MSVIEVGFPSGFVADKTGVSKHKLLKRVEDGDKKIILYLDEVRYQIILLHKSRNISNIVQI